MVLILNLYSIFESELLRKQLSLNTLTLHYLVIIVNWKQRLSKLYGELAEDSNGRKDIAVQTDIVPEILE